MSATATSTVGFAPDSAYGTRTKTWRAAADRMEGEYNARAGTQLARLDAERRHTVRGMSDDSLRRLATKYRRDLEDIEAGDKPRARKRMVKAQLHDIECEQSIREALAECWLASEDGTHCYSAFQGRGGLVAVHEHGARRASYKLAELLDWERKERGLWTVLGWPEPAEAA